MTAENTLTSRKRLRIGVLNDDTHSSKYVYDLVAWAQDEPNLEITHLILHPNTRQDSARSSRIVGLWGSLSIDSVVATLSCALFRRVCLAETLFLKRSERHRDHLGRFDLASLISAQVTILPLMSPSGLVYRFAEDDVRKIEELDLDLLIRCGSGILRGAILKAARLGIISFHHADNRTNRGGPAGFWEVYLREDTTGFTIQRLTEELDGGEVLMRGHFSTQNYYLLNQAHLYHKSNYYLKQLIRRIADTGHLPATLPSFPYSRRLFRTPTVGYTVKYLLRNVTLKVRKSLEQWLGIAYRWRVAFLRGNWREAVLWRGIRLPNPSFHYLADPFVLSRDGRDFCFVEDYDYQNKNGTIAVYELGKSTATRLGTALREDFDLSFPYIFEFKGELLMIPETLENQEIRVYRCVEFPMRWEIHRILMQNVSAAATMILEKNGKWWMFTNMDPMGGGDHYSELSIFYADSPLADDWKPHALNPVVVDASRSRNAGLVAEGERLYRISQGHGSSERGRNALINEVIVLTEETYAENCVSEITPDFQDDILGLHHFHGNGTVTVFDFGGLSRIRRPQ
jgi:hypothetical protein